MRLRYFDVGEFDSPDQRGSGVLMSMQFLRMLDDAREHAKTPFRITSGYRTVQRNAEVGGVPNSSHLLGLACDIAVSNSETRAKIVNGLIHAGFTRIGVSTTFVHCDIDKDKPTPRMWLYNTSK